MTAPILVFDSGVGGLSVLAPIRARLPHVPVVYAADNAGFPYGTKTEAEIAGRVPALLGRLVERYRPRARRHRVQHRVDHRARRGAGGARRAGRRDGAGDQAGGGAVA